MNTNELLEQSRKIWRSKCSIEEVVIRMGKVFGDICRYARNERKDQAVHTDEEIKKELGNISFINQVV